MDTNLPPLRLAMIGSGGIARVHAHACAACPEIALTAVVNHRPDSMAAFAADFHIPHQFDAIEALIEAELVDAVLITTPNALHAPQTIAALRGGLHVLVEKPVALNAAEAVMMQQAAEETGRLLMVAHCLRFDPEVNWLKGQIEAGALGQIVRTHGYGVHVGWGPAGWFTDPALAGGGALLDMGVHAIDTTRYLLGDPAPLQVTAHIGTHYQPIEVDDTALLAIRWDNNVTSVIEAGWWQPFSNRDGVSVQLFGQQGYGGLYPTELSQMAGEDTVVAPFAFPRPAGAGNQMYVNQLRHFASCIQSGNQPLTNVADSIINMELIDNAYGQR